MDNHNNNNNFNMNAGFAVPFHDPYETPVIPSFFDFPSPTLDDLSIFNINNNNNNNEANNNGASFSALLQHQMFNNVASSSSPALSPLLQQQDFSFSALSPLPQQQDFIDNGIQLQQGSTSYSFPMMNPLMQDNFLNGEQSSFSFGGQQGAGNFQFQAVSSTTLHGERSHPPNANLGTQNSNQEYFPLSYWPQTPLPLICSSCQVLREILHTNGLFFEKLVIHGRIGMFTHALHHKDISWDGSSTGQYDMIDLSRKTIEEVKQFLVKYCEQRNLEGFIILQDPLSAYYEALSTGMDWIDELKDDQYNSDDGFQVDDIEEQEFDNVQGCDNVQEGGNAPTSNQKRDLAVQRERAAKMRLTDLSNYFHLPIEEASKQVNLCPTVLKKVCRKDKLTRWPHRKVKSLMKQISILRVQAQARPNDPVTREKTRAEITKHKQEIIQNCGGIVPGILQNITQQ